MGVALLQTVRSVIADRQQPQGPIYRARIYEYTHVMRKGNAYLVMEICIFDNARIRAR